MEILSVPGIAGVVWGMIELFAKSVPASWKPPLAGVLGAAWALAGFVTVPGAYDNGMVAIAAGLTAGGLAVGIDATRRNYSRSE